MPKMRESASGGGVGYGTGVGSGVGTGVAVVTAPTGEPAVLPVAGMEHAVSRRVTSATVARFNRRR